MSEQDGFTLDTSRWPLVVVNVARRPVTDAELDAFMEAQRAMLRRRERYVEIADTTHVHMFPPSQRKKMAEFLRETNPAADQLCAGLSLVVGNAVVRGGMTAIFWIFQPTYPVKAVATFAEAADFLRHAAASAGLALPPSARDYLARGPVAAAAR